MMPTPSKFKARCIDTAEGRFISIDDIKSALNDDAFVMECAAVMAVGVKNERPVMEILRRTIGCCIFILSGAEDEMEARSN